MQINAETGIVAGTHTLTTWAQVIHLPYGVGVVEVHGEEAGIHGKVLVETINREVGELGSDIQTAYEKVRGLISNSVVTILLMLPKDDSLGILLVGEGAAYLKRGSVVAKLLTQEGVLVGQVQTGDTVLLSSQSCAGALSSDSLLSEFDSHSAPEIAEKLTLELHKESVHAGGAALVYQVREIVPDAIDTMVTSFAQPTVLPVETMTSDYVEEKKFSQSSRRMNGPSISGRLQGIRERIAHSISGLREGRNLRDPRIWMRIGVGVLILFFIVSVGMGIAKQQGDTKSKNVEAVLTEATRAMEEGVALRELNAIKSRENLAHAQTLVDSVKGTVKEGSVLGRRVSELSETIATYLVEVLQVRRVVPEVFFDAALLKQNAVVTDMAMFENTLVLLDKTSGTISVVDITSKNGQVAGGGAAYAGASNIAIHGTSVFSLVPAGIHELSVSSKKTKEAIIKKDDEKWGTITAMTAFAGNVYLLDTGKNRIWKYVATDAGFSDTREYLNPDIFPDLSSSTSIAIDGSIWLGSSIGKILKFTQGREDTFTPKGVDPAFGSTLSVYTDDESERLYVLDHESSRIVVLGKDGTYIAQYVWDTLKPSKILVSETAKKILLLVEGKVYGISVQ